MRTEEYLTFGDEIQRLGVPRIADCPGVRGHTLGGMVRAALLLVLLVYSQSTAFAQQNTIQPDTGYQARPWLAVGQGQLINLFVNRVDAWAFSEEWAHVGPSDWSRNLRLGWEWDENEFGTNMFSHPYHGALYFNAGRSHGLDYWESVPLAFLGSFAWEYFGETNRPSLNDFFMTSFGGIALGEMFHRVSITIRDNQTTGRTRTMRELAAAPLDPIGAFNRVVSGDWRRMVANPPEHTPDGYVLRVIGGLRVTDDSGEGSFETKTRSATLVADLNYGDPFRQVFQQPFDVFSVRLQVSPAGGINLLRASGRVYGRDLTRLLARHLFAINQRYDYASNPAHKFGSQSIEAGVYSRWPVGREFALRTQLFADAIVMAALDAPDSGFGERTYDFGPGLGARLEASFERSGITYATIYGRAEYVHSVSGAQADHLASFSGLEITIPIAYHLGVGMHTGYYARTSRYTDRPREIREYPETRLFLVWAGSTAKAIKR